MSYSPCLSVIRVSRLDLRPRWMDQWSGLGMLSRSGSFVEMSGQTIKIW